MHCLFRNVSVKNGVFTPPRKDLYAFVTASHFHTAYSTEMKNMNLQKHSERQIVLYRLTFAGRRRMDKLLLTCCKKGDSTQNCMLRYFFKCHSNELTFLMLCWTSKYIGSHTCILQMTSSDDKASHSNAQVVLNDVNTYLEIKNKW